MEIISNDKITRTINPNLLMIVITIAKKGAVGREVSLLSA